MTLDIMGTQYKFTIKKYDDDPVFAENSFDGYCDGYAKSIIVCDMHTYPGWNKEKEATVSLPADAPSVPSSLNGMAFGTANDIEKLLYVIDTTLTEVETERYSRIDRAVASFAYAGVMYCGE